MKSLAHSHNYHCHHCHPHHPCHPHHQHYHHDHPPQDYHHDHPLPPGQASAKPGRVPEAGGARPEHISSHMANVRLYHLHIP